MLALREGAAKIARIRQLVEQRMAADRRLQRLMRQVRMVETSDGVQIDLVDDADFSMFALGTTILTDEARALLGLIGARIAQDRGRLAVRGHTDALPYRPGARVNNWSLSAGRAEATRQALLSEGVAAARFRRIEGVAETEPLIGGDPADPRNRRISILLAD